MQSRLIKTMRFRVWAFVAALLTTNMAFADRGDNQVEVLGGTYISETLPLYLHIGYHYGFNEQTDLALLVAADSGGNNTHASVSVGSFYTHQIGDISPQYGFSIGPRIDMSDKTARTLATTLHIRAIFDLNGKNQLVASYSPSLTFGASTETLHLLGVGIRF